MAIKKGTVVKVFPEKAAAQVTFRDHDSQISDILPIITRGSGVNKEYWLPDVGEEVVCLMTDGGEGEGWIAGTYYNEAVLPEVSSPDIRRIKFSDGSYIEHNRADGSLDIVCTGPIKINGTTINLN